MSDDAPTQRLPETPGAPDAPADPTDPATVGELARERTKSRALLVTLIGVGAALLVAIIVLLVLLLPRGTDPQAGSTTSPSPTATDTPSATPTASDTPSATPEPTDDAPDDPAPPPVSTIISYAVSATDAGCADDGDSREITFNWNTTGSSVAFGIGTEFAESGAYQTGLAAVGGITVSYQCGEDGPDQIYSIAVIGPNGEVIGRKTLTIRD